MQNMNITQILFKVFKNMICYVTKGKEQCSMILNLHLHVVQACALLAQTEKIWKNIKM